LSLLASTTFSAATDTLSHKLERKAPVSGQVIRLNRGNATQFMGQRSIIMGTARQLTSGALILQGKDGRGYELPDGVYRSRQGFQIHIRKGRVESIAFAGK